MIRDTVFAVLLLTRGAVFLEIRMHRSELDSVVFVKCLPRPIIVRRQNEVPPPSRKVRRFRK